MIISAPLILPLRRNGESIRSGAVVVRGNAVVAVGPAGSLIRRFPSHKVISFCDAVLMPGLVNVHTHLELPSLLDAVRAASFTDWVLNLIAAKRKLTLRDYVRAASSNIRRLIETGTTTVGEICTHDVSPSLLNQSGLRAVIFREIISMEPGAEIRPLHKADRNTARVQFGLSPHAPYTVSGSALRSLAAYARRRNIRITMHVAESLDEVRLLHQKPSGLQKLYQFAGWDVACAPVAGSAIQYLWGQGILNSKLLAVHAVHVTEDDIRSIKTSRCSVAHCPRSNRELGVGRMPLSKLIDAGITVGLGTDSLASCRSLSMWDEMRSAYRMHVRNGITAEQIITLATKRGAQALGLNSLGTLTPGSKADIIVIPLPKKDTGNIFADLLRESNTCTFSMVDGKILRKMTDGTRLFSRSSS